MEPVYQYSDTISLMAPLQIVERKDLLKCTHEIKGCPSLQLTQACGTLVFTRTCFLVQLGSRKVLALPAFIMQSLWSSWSSLLGASSLHLPWG